MSGVDPISTTGMPADIRNGGTKAQSVYEAGLAFEQQLIEQMTQSLDLTGTDTGDDSSDDDSGTDDSSGDDSSSSIETSTLPQALAQSITDAGGFGLAAQLAQPFIQNPKTDD